MAQRFWEVFSESFRSLFRGRVPLAALLIGTPLAFTLLFGVIYDGNVVNDIALTVYDEDQSSMSRTLIQAYGDSDRFRIVSHVLSEEAMKAEILEGRARAALEIPRDFSKDVRLGQGADYLLMVNSANNMFGNAALAASQEIARSFSVGVGQKLMEGVGLKPDDAMNAAYPVHLGVRITGDPANGYTSFMLAGLMLNGLQIGVMVTLAPLLITEILGLQRGREYPSWLLALAGALPYPMVAFVGFLVSMFVCVHVFAVPMRGSWLDACLLGIAFLTFVTGVLLLFSACVPSRELSLQAPMLYIMPGLLYSGLSWPPFDMSTFAAAFGKLLPMTYVGDALRDVTLSGYAPDLAVNCRTMILAGLGCFLVATLIFDFRRKRAFHQAETGEAAA